MGRRSVPPWCPRTRAEYSKHRNNDGDLPCWDGRCGFDDEKEQRLPAMLAFTDVHREG